MTCKSMHRMDLCRPVCVLTCFVYAFVIMRHWYACPIILALFVYRYIIYMCYSYRGVLTVPWLDSTTHVWCLRHAYLCAISSACYIHIQGYIIYVLCIQRCIESALTFLHYSCIGIYYIGATYIEMYWQCHDSTRPHVCDHETFLYMCNIIYVLYSYTGTYHICAIHTEMYWKCLDISRPHTYDHETWCICAISSTCPSHTGIYYICAIHIEMY